MSSHRWREHAELEKRVRSWLESNAASYVNDSGDGDSGDSPQTPRVDILVLKPFQLAIEIILHSALTPHSLALKSKRLLAKRIAVAERFGPYLPLVVVTSNSEPLEADGDPLLSFVDAVFGIDRLPLLSEMRGQIRLNPLTQRIFRQGNPKDIAISDPDKMLSLWKNDVSIEEIHRSPGFPAGTLAERIRIFLHNQLQHPAERDSAREGTGSPTPMSDVEMLIRRRRVTEQIDTFLRREVVNRLGGRFTSRRVTLPEVGSPLSFNISVWESPRGHLTVIRKLLSQGVHMTDKAQELYADAWLLRAFEPYSAKDFVLLYGHTKDSKQRTISGVKSLHAVEVKSINTLESAGWKVLPFDFAEEEPAFISYLQQWS